MIHSGGWDEMHIDQSTDRGGVDVDADDGIDG
jgi:hypothetical protein